jgi:hypothetical protein
MPAQEATGSCGGLRTFRKRRISVDIDPQRQFAHINYRIAKRLFDHLVGNGEHRSRHLNAERSRPGRRPAAFQYSFLNFLQ